MDRRFHPLVAAALLMLGVLPPSIHAQQSDCPVGVIETVAGGGVGDGGPSTEAVLDEPAGIAVGADGSFFVADADQHRIRQVDPAGIITTVAGNGTRGYSGDGGPATEAALHYPRAAAVGGDGSLYIADMGNHRIRKVSPDGTIMTLAGDGWQDGQGRGRFAGDGGPAAAASLGAPNDIALGSDGSLYVADAGNHRVRKIGALNGRLSPDGVITTVAGSGERGHSGDGGPAVEASLDYPAGVALGPEGTVYIADSGRHRIRAVDPGGMITTVAGDGWSTGRSRIGRLRGDGGPASAASLNRPEDVAVGADGTIYIADSGNSRVRAVDADGTVTTFAGGGRRGYFGDGGPATRASVSPAGLALAPDGSVYIAEGGQSHRVRRVDPAGTITTVAGNGTRGYCGDGRPAAEASLDWPWGVAVAPDGTLYVADGRNNRIRRVGPTGLISTFAGTGQEGYSGDEGPAAEAALNRPAGLALAPDGGLYIADSRNHRIRKIGPDGTIATVAGDGWKNRWGRGRFSGDGGPAVAASLNRPTDITLGADGSLYIADHDSHRVRRVDPKGIITTVAGTGERGYSGDGGPAIEAALRDPYAVAAGPDGSLYIADTRNYRVRKLDADGVITTMAGRDGPGYAGDDGPATETRVNRPMGLAIGPDGELYIADSGNDCIRRVTPLDGRTDGAAMIITVAGSGYEGSWGDGGIATEAKLHSPFGLAVGADSTLYFADAANHCVRGIRWLPCQPEAAKMAADETRDKAGDSVSAWRQLAELYVIAGFWDEATAAAERLIALASDSEETLRLRGEIVAARISAARHDDHAARQRLVRVLGRAGDPAVLQDATNLLVDVYLRRGERDQAIATLNDLRLRTNDRRLLAWIDERLRGVAGG